MKRFLKVVKHNPVQTYTICETYNPKTHKTHQCCSVKIDEQIQYNHDFSNPQNGNSLENLISNTKIQLNHTLDFSNNTTYFPKSYDKNILVEDAHSIHVGTSTNERLAAHEGAHGFHVDASSNATPESESLDFHITSFMYDHHFCNMSTFESSAVEFETEEIELDIDWDLDKEISLRK